MHRRSPFRAARAARLSFAALVVTSLGCEEAIQEASSGFDPALHSPQFHNFAGYISSAVLDVDGAQRMFGDAVCEEIVEGRCIPTAATEHWLGQANTSTRGGLCEGFAATAHLAWKGDLDLTPFGGETFSDLSRVQNAKLDRELAYWFMTQYAGGVLDDTRLRTATEAAEILSEAFRAGKEGETYRLGILRVVGNSVFGGHALTPYAMKEGSGPGLWEVSVYDSNFPGEGRTLLLDTQNDTWQYVASVNPGEPEGLYEGGPGNRNPLYLTPNSARVGEQACAFCSGQNSQAVTFNGALDVSVTDGDGNTAGESKDGLGSSIPGATVAPSFSNLYRDDAPYTFRFENALDSLHVMAESETAPGSYDDIEVVAYGTDGTAGIRGSGLGGLHELFVARDSTVDYVTTTRNGGPLFATLRSGTGKRLSVSLEVDADVSADGVGLGVARAADDGRISFRADAAQSVLRINLRVQNDDGSQSSATYVFEADESSTYTTDTDDFIGGETVFEVDIGSDGTVDETVVALPCVDDPACGPFGNDGDIVPTDEDNCPDQYNNDQLDLDGDGLGDACDADKDGDGVEAGNDCDDSDAGDASYCRCAPGSWDDDGDETTACSACAEGEFCPGGTAARTSCAEGTWDHDSDARSACVACEAGSYCAGEAADPAPCLAGSRDDDDDAATECVTCQAGTTCAGGTAAPVACPAGTYDADRDAASACVPCPSGAYCAGGDEPRVSCPVGTFDDDGDATTACATCAAGTFCGGGSSSPSACAPGTVDDDDSAATLCVACAAGSHCAGADGDEAPCAAGTRDHDSDPATDCLACSAGEHCAAGSVDAEVCSGALVDVDRSPDTPCAACPVGSTPLGDGLTCRFATGRWLTTWGDENDDLPVGSGRTMDVAIDVEGNLYIAATTGSDLRVDGVDHTFSRFGGVVFSLDAAGAHRWAVPFSTTDAANGGDHVPTRIDVDPFTGDVFVVATGFSSAAGSATVDGVPIGTMNEIQTGTVTRLRASTGALVWGRTFNDNTGFSTLRGLSFGANGTVVVAGAFIESLDVGVASLISAAGSNADGFVAFLDVVDGFPFFAFRTATGPASEQPNAVLAMPNGDTVVAGQYESGTLTLDGVDSTYSGTGVDGYYAIYDAGGAYLGGFVRNTTGDEVFQDLRLSPTNDVLLAGSYSGSFTLGTTLSGPGAGAFLALVSALDGSASWLTGVEGGSTRYGLQRIRTDALGRVWGATHFGAAGGTFGGLTVDAGTSGAYVFLVDAVDGAALSAEALVVTGADLDLNAIAVASRGGAFVVGSHDGAGAVDGLTLPRVGAAGHDQLLVAVGDASASVPQPAVCSTVAAPADPVFVGACESCGDTLASFESARNAAVAECELGCGTTCSVPTHALDGCAYDFLVDGYTCRSTCAAAAGTTFEGDCAGCGADLASFETARDAAVASCDATCAGTCSVPHGSGDNCVYDPVVEGFSCRSTCYCAGSEPDLAAEGCFVDALDALPSGALESAGDGVSLVGGGLSSNNRGTVRTTADLSFPITVELDVVWSAGGLVFLNTRTSGAPDAANFNEPSAGIGARVHNQVGGSVNTLHLTEAPSAATLGGTEPPFLPAFGQLYRVRLVDDGAAVEVTWTDPVTGMSAVLGGTSASAGTGGRVAFSGDSGAVFGNLKICSGP